MTMIHASRVPSLKKTLWQKTDGLKLIVTVFQRMQRSKLILHKPKENYATHLMENVPRLDKILRLHLSLPLVLL